MTFLRRALLALLVATLSACGGGGGVGGDDDLYVSIYWPSQPVSVLHAATIAPVTSGFEGHDPKCSQTTGRLPNGMALTSRCFIVGRPTEAGFFNIGVRVGAEGVSNKLDFSASVQVSGPSVIYDGHSSYLGDLVVGSAVDDAPRVIGWSAPTDMAVSWSYSLVGGTLPSGLNVDPATGHIVGTVSGTGFSSATIQARVNSAAGSYVAPASVYAATVGAAGFAYVNTGGTGDNFGSPRAYLGQPFAASPQPNAKAPAGSTLGGFSLTYGTLPAGLTLDAASGVVSGTPSGTPGSTASLGLLGSVISNGVSSLAEAGLSIAVFAPLTVSYPAAVPGGQIGAPFALSPSVTVVSPLALGTPTYSYGYSASECSLPSGLALDATTGVVSGTPTSSGYHVCNINITTTLNGASWTTQSLIAVVIN